MAAKAGGSGRVASAKDVTALRRTFGLDLSPTLDLNRATRDALATHPLVGVRLAGQIAKFRKKDAVRTPQDLFHAGLITAAEVRVLEQVSFGKTPIRPLVTAVGPAEKRVFVGEPFGLRVQWLRGTIVPAELLSITTRFPSGAVRHATFRLSAGELAAGEWTGDGFESGESGECVVAATLRDASGGVSRLAGSFGIFTRNPVQIFVTPSFWTQSGRAGAPKFNFGERRWYCNADVRWVNGESRSVNLGRRVTVRMTDAGSEIGTFSFDLSGDIVIPAHSTVYGSWFTWHAEGSAAFNVFHAKGDLTYQYTMNGDGFSPAASQIWRTMRVIGYNIIRVGDFSGTERSEYTRAARDIASGILQSRDMTVYGVELYRIEGSPDLDADKERFRFIDSQAEINAMRSKYTVPNWYLDVFFVEGRWDGSFGSSPADGPVDKQGDSSGLVIRRDSDTVNLGQTFAHEAGHYLGLEHADADDGCADTDPADPNISDNFIFSASRSDSDVITRCQIDKMRRHGLVRSMTP